jgi:cytochrome c biogenesis protein CcmG/thiol:disulfide interchange protein DsbE
VETGSSANKLFGWVSVGVLLGSLVFGLGLGWLMFRPDLHSTQTGPAPASVLSANGTILFTTLSAPAGSSSSAPAPVAGAPAPDFTLKSLDGGEVSLSQFRSQPVLINFWASWCPPCRLEMPDLVKAYEAHKAEGFVILGVNLTSQDSLPEVQAFVKEFNMTFPVLLDEAGHVAEDLYRLRGLPLSVFVNRDGVITRLHLGAMTASQIDEYVGEILK